jgi:hypothetical protein
MSDYEDDVDDEDDDGLLGECSMCGTKVYARDLPDMIARDAFKDFGLCLNCQWGLFEQNGGHF